MCLTRIGASLHAAEDTPIALSPISTSKRSILKRERPAFRANCHKDISLQKFIYSCQCHFRR